MVVEIPSLLMRLEATKHMTLYIATREPGLERGLDRRRLERAGGRRRESGYLFDRRDRRGRRRLEAEDFGRRRLWPH